MRADTIFGDWNGRFQNLVTDIRRAHRFSSHGMKKTSDEVLADSYSGMLRLTQDFEYAAVTYAKIIVSELALPPQQKSIKPMSRKTSSLPLRGECYAVQSIVFHVTNSSLLQRNTHIDEASLETSSQELLFGDIDYISTKLLGNDMRGATSLFNCDSSAFHVPLRLMIDYNGFRLLASSLLPIHNDDVIASESISSAPFLQTELRRVAHQLKLQLYQRKDVTHCFLAPELEFFASLRDRRTYLLNFHRLIPREVDSTHEEQMIAQSHLQSHSLFRSHSHRQVPSPSESRGQISQIGQIGSLASARRATLQLRPNFLAALRTPLCAGGDASDTVDGERHLQALGEASSFLRERLVPAVAAGLLGSDTRVLGYAQHPHCPQHLAIEASSASELVLFLHENGVNLRHLGRVRLALLDPRLVVESAAQRQRALTFATVCLIEMCARTVKQITRLRWRQLTLIHRRPVAGPFRRMVAAVFNRVFGAAYCNGVENPSVQCFWNETMRATLKLLYPFALSVSEDNAVHFRREVLTCHPDLLPLLLKRTCTLLGVELGESFFFDPASTEPIDELEITSIEPVLKSMGIVSMAKGYLYMLQSQRLLHRFSEKGMQCLNSAISSFAEALNASYNKIVLRELARVILDRTILLTRKHDSRRSLDLKHPDMERAQTLYEAAIEKDPLDDETLYQYSRFWRHFQQWEEAEKWLLLCLQQHPNHTEALNDLFAVMRKLKRSNADARQILHRCHNISALEEEIFPHDRRLPL